MKGYRNALLMAVLVGLAAPDAAAAQSRTVERILERMGDAVARAVTAVDGVFADPGDYDVAWSRQADDFRWTGSVARGDLIEIKGINGPIEVVRAPGSEVEIRAQARGRRSDPDEVRIEMVEHAEGLTFCAVYPTPRGKRENYCGPGSEGRMSTHDVDVQVRFLVQLPDGW